MGKRKATYKYGPTTSYLDFAHVFPMDKNIPGFEKLIRERAVVPRRVYEGMAGIGFQARVIKTLYPNLEAHRVWDLDPRCCEELKKIPDLEVNCGDFFKVKLKLLKGDMLIADANTFTLKQWEFHRPLFLLGAGQVVSPDVARGKLHLHWKSAYKLSEPTMEAYLDKLAEVVKRDTGMKFMGYEKCPRSGGYHLWSRL